MINSPVPPQLPDIIARVEEAQSGKAVDDSELDQLLIRVGMIEEHLGLVARAIDDRSKTGTRSHYRPFYAFGPENAANAQRATSHLPSLRLALINRNWEDAIQAGRQVQQAFD
jgi:hypothetical protein